jgi:hypothetical protein
VVLNRPVFAVRWSATPASSTTHEKVVAEKLFGLLVLDAEHPADLVSPVIQTFVDHVVPLTRGGPVGALGRWTK